MSFGKRLRDVDLQIVELLFRSVDIMNRWLLSVCVFASAVLVANPARAQFTDARSYENAPVGTNQLELSYAYVQADASIDASLVVTGASLDLNQATINYARYFGLSGRLMWLEAAVPVARLGGSIRGTNIHGDTAGAGDSSYGVSMLLKGGPALTDSQFDDYTPTTVVGVSVAITAPTGSYQADRILNLGSDRWSFKPELALSHPFGPEQKWTLDTYANVYLYTDNTSYRGRQLLRQEPLAGFEGHLSYSFTDNVWVAFDSRYSFRGATSVDHVSQENHQRNFGVGGEVSIALNSRNSLLVGVAKAPVHVNGPALAGVSVKYDYTWSGRRE